MGKGPGRLPDGSLPTSSTFPRMFSDCSRAYLEGFLEQPQSACLANAPDLSHLVGGPVCGNLFVERGEQCDCGPPEVRPYPAPAPVSMGCHDLCPFRSGRPLHEHVELGAPLVSKVVTGREWLQGTPVVRGGGQSALEPVPAPVQPAKAFAVAPGLPEPLLQLHHVPAG